MELDRRIKENSSKLTDLENSIIYYILNNRDIIFKKTINELAIINNVSVSMINKTLNKVGVAGFKELKVLLAQDNFLNEWNNNTNNSFLEVESNIFLNSLHETSKNLSINLLKKISKEIEVAEQTVVLGEGFMTNVAKDFSQKLNKIQIQSKTIRDVEGAKYINVNKKTILFILSVSGTTGTLKKILFILKKRIPNLFVVVVTATQKCSFVDMADVHVHGYYKSFIDTYEKEIPTVSRMVIQFIMDLIFRNIFMSNSEKYKKFIEEASIIY